MRVDGRYVERDHLYPTAICHWCQFDNCMEGHLQVRQIVCKREQNKGQGRTAKGTPEIDLEIKWVKWKWLVHDKWNSLTTSWNSEERLKDPGRFIIQICPTYNDERCSRHMLIKINIYCQYIILTIWKHDTFCWMTTTFYRKKMIKGDILFIIQCN